MDRILHVVIDSAKVGTLTRQENGDFVFAYTADWLSSRAPIPLSLSLPLQLKPFPSAVTKAFFANLLPEGQLRDHFAGKYRTSPDDDFGLLAALGGDCAGALALFPGSADFSLESKPPNYKPLSEDDLGKLLDEAYIMDPSFLGTDERTRLSLAGVQDKLPVSIDGGTILLPLDGSPSTHILKPPNHRFPTLVENEAFCMTLAGKMGLAVPAVSLRRTPDGEPFYLVERYDRKVGKDGLVSRIHQEDFCQATGTSYRLKYEEKGGPGFRECFAVVARCRNPLADRIKLVELAVFNYLTGNADCHAKNISLLYDSGPNPSLAPFYDLVCTAVYNLSRQMAMGVGGVHDPRGMDAKAWSDFAEQAGIRSPKPVMATVERMATAISGKAAETADTLSERYGKSPVYAKILQVIEQRAEAALRQIRNH